MRPLFVAVIALAACSESSAPRERIVIDPESLELQVGSSSTVRVTSTRLPRWTSSAPGIASVSGAGVVTAIGRGEARIWAVIDRDSAFASVLVREAKCALTLTIAPASASIAVGDSVQVEASAGCSPSSSFIWASADEAIASVSVRSTGPMRSVATVTARRDGQVTVKASLADDPSVSVTFALVVRGA